MNGGFAPLKGFLGRGRLRPGRRRHAAGRRHALADARHPRREPEVRRRPRAGAGHRAARPGRRDPRDPVGHRQVEPRQVARGREGVRRRRQRPPGGELPAQRGRPHLPGRPDHRHPAAGALRLQGAARHAERAARAVPQARLAPGRGVPDPQPAAPRPPGADLPRRQGGAGQPADPPGRRHDQARRHRPLHPGALLRGGARPVPARHHDDEPAEPGDAHGRPARGGLARDHPPQPRLHPHDRRPRPCRPRQEFRRRGFLRPLRGAGPVPPVPGRDRPRDGRFQTDGLRSGPRPVRACRRGREGRDRSRTSPAPSCAAVCPRGSRFPNGSAFRPWSRSCAAPSRRVTSRASPCSSPASPVRASRPSPTR